MLLWLWLYITSEVASLWKTASDSSIYDPLIRTWEKGLLDR